MIAWLTGKVLQKSPSVTVINVGGVGYQLFISLSTFELLPAKGEVVELHVYTVAREDALLLYGFAEEDERQLFLKLITVSRVGPKLAMQVLSGNSAEAISNMIATQNITALSKINGIGKKTAERLVMELKEKLQATTTATGSKAGLHHADAVEAMLNLGYKQTVAEGAINQALQKEPEAELAQLIRLSLKELAPQK